MKETFRKSFNKSKIGQSAMVATVLLIMMAIIAGVLVTTFSQKSSKRVSEKIVEIGSGVECNDIRLSLSSDGNSLFIRNRGTLGVDQVVLRKYFGDGEPEVKKVDDFDGEEKLMPGLDGSGEAVVYEYSLSSFEDSNFDRVEAKPIFQNEEGDLIGCGEVAYESS